jgi:hypothetical protein
MDVFDYPDPNMSQGTASVADIDIQLVPFSSRPDRPGVGVCAGGAIALNIVIDVHAGAAPPMMGFNFIAPTWLAIEVDGVAITIPTPPATAPRTSVAGVGHLINPSLPTCPKGVQSGTGTITITDLTRQGRRTPNNWSGVSQKYTYTWNYECTHWGICCCVVPIYSSANCAYWTPFTYSITRTYSDTVAPNG